MKNKSFFYKLRISASNLVVKLRLPFCLKISYFLLPKDMKIFMDDLSASMIESLSASGELVRKLKLQIFEADQMFSSEKINKIIGGKIIFSDGICNMRNFVIEENIFSFLKDFALNDESYSAIFDFFAIQVFDMLEAKGYYSIKTSMFVFSHDPTDAKADAEYVSAVNQFIANSLTKILLPLYTPETPFFNDYDKLKIAILKYLL